MTPTQSRPGGIPTVSVQDAARRHGPDGDALLVDVREMSEFVELRIDGATLVPMSQLGVRFRELPQDRPLLMLCRSGARSGSATTFLIEQGFNDVSNVEGGMIAWTSAGLPTRNGPLEPGEGDL